MEHIRIGNGYTISQKYYIRDEIEILLNDIDADYLFGDVEGNPDDAVNDALEKRIQHNC